MELLDLPPEIFERIITKYVAEVGLCEAWKHREVCSEYDNAGILTPLTLNRNFRLLHLDRSFRKAVY
jgi:hypothetical protein